MMPTSRVHVIAHKLLDAVTVHYEGLGVDLPPRRYVSPGPPAWDCECAVVFMSRIFPFEGDVSREVLMPLGQAAGYGMRGGEFGITVVRCDPQMIDSTADGKPIFPSIAKIEATSTLVDHDGVLIADAVLAATSDESGFLDQMNDVAIGALDLIGPEGGFVGVVQRVRVSLAAEWGTGS